MNIGDRLYHLREEEQLSQADIEKRSGLLRNYISRVENGHTVPSVATIEKFAHAIAIPMHHLLNEGEEPPKPPKGVKRRNGDRGNSGKDANVSTKFSHVLARMSETDRLVFAHGQEHGPRETAQPTTWQKAQTMTGTHEGELLHETL